MSAHILFNLLNKLRKRDKMRGLLSILSFVCNKFNKFNNKGAWMLDSIFSYDIENVKILSSFMQRFNGYHYL